MVRLLSSTLVLLAALQLSGASPSVVTLTSSYTSTAVTTITTSIPSVSITSTCTWGTVAPTGCANTIWYDAGNYWSATCTTSAYSASTTKMTYSWVTIDQCSDACTHYSNCAGINWDDSETCRILAGSLELVPVSSSVLAAELFLFDPCTSRVTSYVPETLTRTSTTAYTSLIVSTLTPTPTPTSTLVDNPTPTPSTSVHLIPSASSAPVLLPPTSARSSSSAPATLSQSSGSPLATSSSIVSTRSSATVTPMTSAAPAPSSVPDEVETLYSTIYTTEVVTFFTECAF
ncbi:hypothetical protein ASPACDRAFT_1889703 [Aspergillus aculeatus ATCC 16872]|uniref:Apple domain-containing protein n=1 Tax=Aspergillus aculeatus (strain ATCC 16872 / CBS 172.66 / WB 5094) TaxID=690307 RepID=A0A1L9WQT5_ASPA1|nr:uncharacterized protein ASPACDRAFT_1889703 [Aspergillus aculeatus ATCC 16872]OJJ98541.1 hypothetical protein ASPACDRAFT_1889703 [Aspergillus aculeatus ATCC 16872]